MIIKFVFILFKYFNISPSLSLKSDWVNRSYSGFIDSTGLINKNEVLGFASRTTGSFNLNMNTQIYGLFPIEIGNLKSIRHVASPSIGYSFRPDFSKEVFGKNPNYYEVINQDNGEVVYFDRFSGTLAGGTPRGENQSVNLSVNNVFQAKVKENDQEVKKDLFSWRLSTSNNLVLDQYNWGNLNSSIRANIRQKLNLDFSMTHDWYDFDSVNNNLPCSAQGGSHGSIFNLDGSVQRGPASRALTSYNASINSEGTIITINQN